MLLRKLDKSVPHKISELAELKNKMLFMGGENNLEDGPLK